MKTETKKYVIAYLFQGDNTGLGIGIAILCIGGDGYLNKWQEV